MTQQHRLDLNDAAPLKTIDEYQFEPIRGYPMLQWAGKRPYTSTQYFPAQLKETHGPEVNGWRNKIYWGDNLQIMSHMLKEFRGKVKLIYIDPPFDSKTDYKKMIQVRGQSVSNDMNTFEEKQYTDIWTNDEYLQYMYERLILMRELLADDGSIYLHCDWHKSHYLRCIMDEIFGSNKFRNEIIWRRSLPHNDPNKYGSIHDTLLFYVNGNEYIFNQQFIEQSEGYKKSHYTSRDSDGRIYRLQSLSASGSGPSRIFGDNDIAPPVGNHWRFSQEKINELMDAGLILFTSTGQPNFKRYLDESKGSALQSIWTDIHPLNSQAKERLDYPTQKPEPLLERIISASSNHGDIVFDCFMGSGTTQTVAMKLGRRFIGADINLGAVQITTKRLITDAIDLQTQQPLQKELVLDEEVFDDDITTFYTGLEVYNVNNYDIFRNPVEARDLLIQALELIPLDRGGLYDGERDGRLWKIMPVNRIATRSDLNELINGFNYSLFESRQKAHPNEPVEKITLVCMGHEPDLGSSLLREVNYTIDVKIVDILRDHDRLEFKRDAEAVIVVKGNKLVIEQFYPLNLLKKLSLQQESVGDWRELVDSIMIDWNYDGAIFQPTTCDIPENNTLVAGTYPIPADAGTIRVKITDLLSESLEKEIPHA